MAVVRASDDVLLQRAVGLIVAHNVGFRLQSITPGRTLQREQRRTASRAIRRFRCVIAALPGMIARIVTRSGSAAAAELLPRSSAAQPPSSPSLEERTCRAEHVLPLAAMAGQATAHRDVGVEAPSAMDTTQPSLLTRVTTGGKYSNALSWTLPVLWTFLLDLRPRAIRGNLAPRSPNAASLTNRPQL